MPSDPKALLRVGYGLVPIVAGADKFTNLLADWEQYLSPEVERRLPVDGRMNVRPSTGSRRSTSGLKYCSQSASRLVNLSAPATIGTSPYPTRNSAFGSEGMPYPLSRQGCDG